MVPIEVHVVRVGNRGAPLPLPRYQTEYAAGLDLLADLEVILEPGARALVPTGIAIELPPGFEAQVRPRSGLALHHGVTLLNSPGTIDSDYRGEIQVLLVHLGTQPIRIARGDRIAQLVVAPVTRVAWSEAENLNPTQRAAGGFGHTGRRDPD